MAKQIDLVEKVAVTTSAKDIGVNCRAFYIQNTSADATIYIKEKADDNTAVTVDNGFEIPAGTTFKELLRAKTLSIKGSASCTAKIMYVLEDM